MSSMYNAVRHADWPIKARFFSSSTLRWNHIYVQLKAVPDFLCTDDQVAAQVLQGVCGGSVGGLVPIDGQQHGVDVSVTL